MFAAVIVLAAFTTLLRAAIDHACRASLDRTG